MLNKELYEVDRKTYSDFIHNIKPGSCYVETPVEGQTLLISKHTQMIYCERNSTIDNKEKYYVYEWNINPDDWQEYVPAPSITLTTPEQVQKFFEYLKTRQHE